MVTLSNTNKWALTLLAGLAVAMWLFGSLPSQVWGTVARFLEVLVAASSKARWRLEGDGDRQPCFIDERAAKSGSYALPRLASQTHPTGGSESGPPFNNRQKALCSNCWGYYHIHRSRSVFGSCSLLLLLWCQKRKGPTKLQTSIKSWRRVKN